MRRLPMWTAGLLTVTIGMAACGRSDAPAETSSQGRPAQATGASASGGADQVTVNGCLSAGPNGTFVLTASAGAEVAVAARAGSGTRETYSYQLVGGQNLQEHLGRRVEVTGKLNEDVDDEVEMETNRESSTAAKSGGQDVTAKVETKEEVDIEVRQLQVGTVRQVAGTCDIGK